MSKDAKIREISCGLLMYSQKDGELKVFLVHPGGPFFKNRDEGYWSIPKGLPEENEDYLDAAKREFEEETNIKPEGEFIPLGYVIQKNKKQVHAWAFEKDIDAETKFECNSLFEMEWPPKSGRRQKFPEVDDGRFFDIETAKIKINSAQAEFLDILANNVS